MHGATYCEVEEGDPFQRPEFEGAMPHGADFETPSPLHSVTELTDHLLFSCLQEGASEHVGAPVDTAKQEP